MERIHRAIGLTSALLVLLFALPVMAVLWLINRPIDRNLTIPGRFLRRVGVALGRCYRPWRFRIEGDWPDQPGPFVVIANHQSHLDVLLLSRLPEEMKWVAKEELFKLPWVGWMLRLSGDIKIRRGDRDSGSRAMDKAAAYLRRGMNVMIFPEGSRSGDATLQPFKTGAFRLAIEAGVPILPIVVSGTAAGLPKGGTKLGPCDGRARILAPVPTTDRPEPEELRDRLWRVMAAELN